MGEGNFLKVFLRGAIFFNVHQKPEEKQIHSMLILVLKYDNSDGNFSDFFGGSTPKHMFNISTVLSIGFNLGPFRIYSNIYSLAMPAAFPHIQ